MSDMITTLAFYMRFPFVRYALIVGVLIALCSSLLGVTLVLKRFSYIGDGLSHVAFGAMAVAAVLNLTNDTLLAGDGCGGDSITAHRSEYQNPRRCGNRHAFRRFAGCRLPFAESVFDINEY